MWIYYHIIFACCAGVFIGMFPKDKRAQQFLLVVFSTYITVFIGMRFHTGADWAEYTKYYNNCLSYAKKYMEGQVEYQIYRFEIGYQIYNWICKFLHLDYYVMQFLATLFFNVSALKFCQRYSKYPLAAYSLFILNFFGPMMSQIRQNIALGIVLITIPYIFKKSL